jgi:hypothetical protein
MNSKFAALFSVIENVVVKKTPPSTTAKNGIFMEFFVRSDGWCCGNQIAA